MKKILIVLLIGIFIFPINIFAKEKGEEDFTEITRQEKFYKVVYYNDNNQISSIGGTNYIVYDISESEYNSANLFEHINPNVSGFVETTYKKMTTYILSNGSNYRYKVTLEWKNLPSTRSYDIIGIGHFASVKTVGDLVFYQEYNQNGTHKTVYAHIPQYFSYGASATFKLPEGSISSLTQTLYYDVEKNTNATILTHKAYGDYSHATSSISESNATNHTVSSSIVLDSSISGYYDAISSAIATWNGSW